MTEREVGPVEQAVIRDLGKWGDVVADTGLAALALDAARRLDAPDVTPTPASMLHAQLRATVESLAALAAEVVEAPKDEVDRVKEQREDRVKEQREKRLGHRGA